MSASGVKHRINPLFQNGTFISPQVQVSRWNWVSAVAGVLATPISHSAGKELIGSLQCSTCCGRGAKKETESINGVADKHPQAPGIQCGGMKSKATCSVAIGGTFWTLLVALSYVEPIQTTMESAFLFFPLLVVLAILSPPI